MKAYGPWFLVIFVLGLWSAACADSGGSSSPGEDLSAPDTGEEDSSGVENDAAEMDVAGADDSLSGTDVSDTGTPADDSVADADGAGDIAMPDMAEEDTNDFEDLGHQDGEESPDGEFDSVDPDVSQPDAGEQDTGADPECGDTKCNGEETCATCPTDCGSCLETCGNGTCGGNETCSTCQQDCGDCPAVCGNGQCETNEGCGTCPADCGCGGAGQVCYQDVCCTPSCTNVTCGSDGCGGVCDKCGFNTVCDAGIGQCQAGTPGCGDTSVFQPGAAWPTHGYCGAHQGRSPFSGPSTNAVKWSFDTGGAVVASPVVDAEGTVYVGSKSGKFFAIFADGTQKWVYDSGKPIESSASIGTDGTVYVGSNNGTVYAFNAKGNIKWSSKIGGQSAVLRGTNLGASGMVTIGVNNDQDSKGLYAISSAGLPLWTGFLQDGDVFTTPAINAAGNVHAPISSSSSYTLWVFKPDGKTAWYSGEFVSAQMSPPTVMTSGVVLFKSNDLLAFDGNGNKLWAADVSLGQSEGGMAIGHTGNIIVGGSYGKLVAFNDSGKTVWSFSAGAPALAIRTTPAVDKDGTIYFGADNMRVYAVSATGTEKWSYLTAGKVNSSPAIGKGGRLYIGSDDGKLYAFGQ